MANLSRRQLLTAAALATAGGIVTPYLSPAGVLSAEGKTGLAAGGTGKTLETLDDVRSHVRLGAEIFLDPSHTREEIRMHFRRMKEVGLSLARVFVIWDHVERKQGHWSFDLYDAAYDAAAANGIPMLTTLCPEDPPGWTRRAPFYHAKLIVNTPDFRRHAGEYLRRVVERYKDHPAQGPWSLANEPGLPEWFDDTTMREFGAWLKARYGSVERLNARWFRPLESFDKVKISADMVSGYWSDIPTAVDWKQFRIRQLCDQLVWIRDQVRRYDAKHPTHVHPAALAHNMPGFFGGDAWAEKQVVDFIGTTIHPIWQLENYRPEDTDLGTAFITDVLRSASGNAPWWVTEMQSGPVVWTAPRAFSPTPEQMTRWIWDDVGAGAKAVVFWCWHPRRFGREGGECGLVHPDGSSTPRSEAVHKIAQALAGPAAFLHAAEPLPPRVAILYSRQSLLLYAADDPHAQATGDRVMLSLLGCHRALCERQVPADFINEDGVKRGAAARYAVLYLPHCYAMDDATVAALRHYVAEGGTLWADGLTAWKDDYGNVRPEMPGGLVDVFGVKADDISIISGEFPLTRRDSRAGEAIRMPLVLQGAEVLEKDAGDLPVATRHRYGKGTAIFFATALGWGYHKHPDPQAGDWIAAPALPQTRAMAVSASTKAPRVFFRGLKCPEGLAAILTNPGSPCRARVAFRGAFAEVADVLAAERIKPQFRHGVSEIEVPLPAGGACVLLARG
ncbi:MAG: beta-galactosidase [Thermoguttaceae bacterium]